MRQRSEMPDIIPTRRGGFLDLQGISDAILHDQQINLAAMSWAKAIISTLTPSFALRDLRASYASCRFASSCSKHPALPAARLPFSASTPNLVELA
ncbi:hypothetical protein [Candidatus Amarolinea dominans]|uniref:hypothetical protein n=1 Tax=Candidatus Amarolinea dominans TaxID=3140696 RepID=UPI001D240867|nr:hypothetical protein [Anaerolineae bacterium]